MNCAPSTQGRSKRTDAAAGGARVADEAANREWEQTRPGFAEEALPHLRAVYRFALRLTRGDEAEAEDLVQDTYLRAFRGWDTYVKGTKCCSWLFTICRNVAIRRGERKLRLEQRFTLLGLEDASTLMSDEQRYDASRNPERDFFDGLLDDEVRRAVENLPPEYREAVVLCDFHGMGYGDIARRLGVADGTIKSRIHRGRKILQRVLYPYAVETGFLHPDREMAGEGGERAEPRVAARLACS